jgi:hypothetical protein
LLTIWRRAGWIVNIGSDKVSRWVSAEETQRIDRRLQRIMKIKFNIEAC